MSWGRSAVDWESRINVDRMRKERLERTRREARKRGLDAMLLLNGDNMRYVGHNLSKANTQGASGARFVLFPTNAEPTLYEFGMWMPYVRDRVDWMKVKRSYSFLAQGPPEARARQLRNAAAEIKKELWDSGYRGDKLAVDVYHLGLANALKEQGIQVETTAGDALSEARKIKTREEVEIIRQAASIAEGGFDKLRRSIRPGVSEGELRANFVGELYRLGMDFVPSGEISSGPRTYVNNVTTSDRIVRDKDIVIAMACSSIFMGYRICYYRTFVCGRANADQKDSFARTRDVLYDAIKVVKPGATTKDIAEKWPRASEFGYEDEDQAIWIQWGHGIGLSIPEDPTASRLWSLEYPQRIEEGMTIALEDWLPTQERSGTYPKGQSVRIEEMMEVTSGGTDLISKYPVDEIIECN
jgi:Xaa-Pro dipeptidase